MDHVSWLAMGSCFVMLGAAAAEPWRGRGEVSLGAFYAWADTGVSFEPSIPDAINAIDLEDDFGLEDAKTFPYLDFYYRFTDKHVINASYFEIDRGDSETIADRIAFEDLIFEAGARVRTNLDTQVLRLAYGYNFYRQDNADIGFLAGLHWTNIDLGAELKAGAAITIDEREEVEIGTEDNANLDFPFPTFGLRGRLDFSQRWSISGWGQLLYVSVDSIDGYYWNSFFTGSYYPLKNLGLNAGWFLFGIDVENGGDNYRYWFNGPTLMLSGRF